MIIALIENAFLSLIASAIPASTVVVLAATGAPCWANESAC